MSEVFEDLRNLEKAGYTPNEAAVSILRQVVYIPIIGPVATGKNAVMAEAHSIDRAFGRVTPSTTRDRRVDEAFDTYQWFPHNEKHLRRIRDQATDRDLAQFKVHPTTGKLYWSYPEDYDHPFSMMDTMADAVEATRRVPFRRNVEIGLVAEAEEWRGRLQNRARETTYVDIRNRLAEGVRSVTWMLDQGDDFIFVANRDARQQDAAREVIGLARGHREPNPSNRHLAEGLLTAIQQVQLEY